MDQFKSTPEEVAQCEKILSAVLDAARGTHVDAMSTDPLRDLTVDGFDVKSLKRDFAGEVLGPTIGSLILNTQLELHFLLGSGTSPFRARFLRLREGWRLATLQAVCTACFGDGVLDGRVCGICDGAGYEASRPIT